MLTRLYCLLICCIVLACGTGEKRDQSKVSSKAVPNLTFDTAIYNLLQLRNAAATPDSIKARINNDSALVFITKDEMEYLIAYPDPLQPPGSFIGFEITGITTKLNDYPTIKTNIERFNTNSGINRRTPIGDVLKSKGEPMSTNSSNGITTYQFKGPPNIYVNANEMYIFEVEEVNGGITRIRFGLIPAKAEEQSTRIPRKIKQTE